MAIHAQITRFINQYLQLEQELDYPESAVLRLDATQETIYRQLFSSDSPNCQPGPRYQLRVLKNLVGRIEASIEDWDQHGVSDNLMSSLAWRLASPLPDEVTAAQNRCYVTYRLASLANLWPSPPDITLLEARSVISAHGTTGMRTWEAALHLGQYLCDNRFLVEGRRILELGAGTAYLSILCVKHLGAMHCLASDGSDSVINAMPDNFFLNHLQDSRAISPLDLKWGHALVGTEEADWNGGRPVDIVLGADITYDKRLVPALVATLEELRDKFPGLQVLVSATERNKETFENFERTCEKRGFACRRLAYPITAAREQMGPFYSDKTPIHICALHLGA